MTPQEKLDKLGDRLKKNHELLSNYPIDTSKESCPHPFDIYSKYDALKKRNDELVEALKANMELTEGEIITFDSFPPKNDIEKTLLEVCKEAFKQAKQALKNNEND